RRMAANDRDLHGDRLVRGGRDDGPLAHLLRAGLALGLRRALPRLAALGAPARAIAPPAHGRASPRLGPLARALLGGALRTRRAGGTRPLALPEGLRAENLFRGLGFAIGPCLWSLLG